MKSLRRHRTILIVLAIYWPAIFLLTHIPVPDIARQSGMSDKMMHLLAYFMLAFLSWYAVSPHQKVNWADRKIWILLTILAAYAALDEFLQGLKFIGRSCDVIDFIANMSGVVIAMGILSMLGFWASMLTFSSVFIFVISNMSRLPALYPQFHADTMFHFTAYALFTLVCIHWLQQKSTISKDRSRWMLRSAVLPTILLAIVKLSLPLFDRKIDWINTSTALFGILSAVLVSFQLFRLTRPKPV